MAVKFLDNTGLGYFWSKIKAWCNATFAAITHNHASNAVSAMTGYSKPSSGSAIATSDSLNSAIGKLEAKVDAVDDNYVHKIGNESITGIKSFSNTYHDTTSGNDSSYESSSVFIRSPNFVKGTVPNTVLFSNLLFMDKEGDNLDWNGRVGTVESCIDANGNSSICIGANKNEVINGVSTKDVAVLKVGYDSNGLEFATAPSTSTTRVGGSDILTRDWIPNDTRIVHTTGDEAIDGYKSFRSNIEISKSNPVILYKNTGITKSTAPSSAVWNKLVEIWDSSSNRFACIEHGYDTNMRNILSLIVYDSTENPSVNPATLTIGVDELKNRFVASTAGLHLRLDISKGTTPQSNISRGVWITGGSNYSWAASCIAQFEALVDTNNQVNAYLRAFKNTANSTTFAQMGVVYDDVSDEKFAYCPPPSNKNDDSNKIATTSWIRRNYIRSTMYVDPVSGNDNNDGFAPGTPIKTIASLESRVSESLMCARFVSVQLNPGTYTDSITGVHGVVIQYWCVANAIIPSVYVSGAKRVIITGNPTLKGGGIFGADNSLIQLGSGTGLSLTLTFNNLNAAAALRLQNESMLRINWNTTKYSIAFTGTCAASTATIYLEPCCYASLGYSHSGSSTTRIQWSGNVTGSKYYISKYCMVSGIGTLANIPGTSAGTADTNTYITA